MRLWKASIVLAGMMAIGLGSDTFACDLLEGVPCEKADAIRQFRADLFDEVRAETGTASAHQRAYNLVRSVFLLREEFAADKSINHFDYSSLPEGTTLGGVRCVYDRPETGDREVRIMLDFPKSWINSPEFNEYNMARIGAEFMAALSNEGFNRTFLYARDPKGGAYVDIQNLLPKDTVKDAKREVDAVSDAMAEELAKSGSGAPVAQKALVPSINPGQPSGALSGKTIYINQSHGWFDDYTGVGRWRVQRGDNFGVLEDFDSATFINMWVLPALRNAGAKVQTVRESDFQTNMVIVDNADAAYAETGTWATSSLNGFKQKAGASWNGTSINPFNQGSGENRLSSGLTSGSPTATATWTAAIPEDGYYNVYASWTAYSARANDAQYLVYHSGGVSEVIVNQKIDGYTWNLLGNFYFEAGAPASERKVVLTNTSSDGTATNVSADAVRWGGGMGDVARHTNGVSSRPRWEEEAVNYLQFNGFGYSGDLYTGSDDEAGGWSDRPQYARWEHSGKDGSVEDALYFAWHTNAFNGSARGLSTFRHSTATAASTTLQDIMHDTLYDHIEGLWFPSWTVRSKNVTNFGENNQTSLGTGLPGFLIEGLFHDNADDAGGYSQPQFRSDMARAIVHGIVEYYEDRDSISLTTPPETPTNLRVTLGSGGTATIAWSAPPNSGSNSYFGDAAASYRLYESSNGFGFDDGTAVAGTSTTVSGLVSGEAKYYRVAAVNAGGQSFPTETLAVVRGDGNVLIVDGFDRNDKGLIPTLSITNAGTDLLRFDPRTFQAFNYAIEHAEALEDTGVGVSSASNEAVVDGDVDLDDYDAVFWILGEESTVDETFSSAEQTKVSDYLAISGANLFLSGAEIGWDLGRATRPVADQDFYNQKLRASYVSDDAGTYSIAATASGPFDGLAGFSFDTASGARYDAEYPDRIGTSNGSSVALSYSGGSGGNAAIYYDGSNRVLHLAFPFETIASESIRADMMEMAVDFFDLAADLTPPDAPTGLAATAGTGSVALDWSDNSEPDLAGYDVYRSTTSGSGYSKINGSLLGSSDYTDNSVTNDTTYYYVVTAVDNASPANDSSYSTQVSATPAPPVPTNSIDFDDYTVGSYGAQDVDSTDWEKLDGGTTIHLYGNTWKIIPLNYTVTANTVIEFDYKSTATEPEVGGICFDNDTTLSGTQTWKVFGTQSYGNLAYDDYSGSNWTHYTIPVGATLTAGSYTYLAFLNDHDSGSGSNSWFRNVLVYDAEKVYDNDTGSPVYTETGSWFTSGSNGYNGGGYRYASTTGSHVATWDLDVPRSGDWKIEVMYRAGANRASSARYEIATASGTQTTDIDQTTDNLVWVTLGTYSIDANSGTVKLNAASSTPSGKVVIADAVRLTYVP